MQLRHVKTLSNAKDNMHKVTAICWSPNNKRMACVTVDRIVVLYDENGAVKGIATGDMGIG